MFELIVQIVHIKIYIYSTLSVLQVITHSTKLDLHQSLLSFLKKLTETAKVSSATIWHGLNLAALNEEKS